MDISTIFSNSKQIDTYETFETYGDLVRFATEHLNLEPYDMPSCVTYSREFGPMLGGKPTIEQTHLLTDKRLTNPVTFKLGNQTFHVIYKNWRKYVGNSFTDADFEWCITK